MNRPAILLLLAALPLAAQRGFPFSADESLHYSITWPSGLSLGEARLTAFRTAEGWNFGATVDAQIPGFALSDKFTSSATGQDLCSTKFERDVTHGGKHTRDKTEFDQREHTARRSTVLPDGGGKTDLEIPSCARDALTFVFFARREMGQGRVAPAQQVYFGNPYSVRMEYTGEQTLPTSNARAKPAVTDRVVVYVKGPSSNFNFEIFFARDPQRTPLSIRIPLPLGQVSLDLAP